MPFRPDLDMRFAELVTRSFTARLSLLQTAGVKAYEVGERIGDVLARVGVADPDGILRAVRMREEELEAAYRRGDCEVWRAGLARFLVRSRVTILLQLGALAPRVAPFDPVLAAAEDVLFLIPSRGANVCQTLDPGTTARVQAAPLGVVVNDFQVKNARKATAEEIKVLVTSWNTAHSRNHKDWADLLLGWLLRTEWDRFPK